MASTDTTVAQSTNGRGPGAEIPVENPATGAIIAHVADLSAERVGPRKVVLVTLAVTIATLMLGAGTGSGALLWVLGPVVGLALGSLSAVDRIFLLRLVPEDRRGEDFSLYALVGKLSSGFGPLVLWGGTVLVMREAVGLSAFDASRVAVGMLAAAALAGLLILRPLSDAVPATGIARAMPRSGG